MKLFVAVPAYDNSVKAETVRSLLNEQGAAFLLGIEIQFAIAPGGSLLPHTRNQIARDFLATDADKLICVDSDVSWNVGELLALAGHDVDFVSGAYRYKEDAEGYPIAWLDKPELWAVNGLLEVSSVPAGFMAVKRCVFERLKEGFPERSYQFHGEQFQAFYHCPPGAGEDGAFCADWRSIGGQIWLDPALTLSHYGGSRQFTGNIGQWLKNR